MAHQFCSCCGHPSAKDYGFYKACSMCAPTEPDVREIEANVNDQDKVRKAKVRESTYKCDSPLCSRKQTLHTSRTVIEWLE